MLPFNICLSVLLQKHNARAAVVLRPQLLSQSFLLADLVGMTIAGLAMCMAVGAIYVATRFSTNQLSGAYVTIIVVGYMLKDRVKEWGKRYLQPAAMKFGFEFPDRTVKVSLVGLVLCKSSGDCFLCSGVAVMFSERLIQWSMLRGGCWLLMCAAIC